MSIGGFLGSLSKSLGEGMSSIAQQGFRKQEADRISAEQAARDERLFEKDSERQRMNQQFQSEQYEKQRADQLADAELKYKRDLELARVKAAQGQQDSRYKPVLKRAEDLATQISKAMYPESGMAPPDTKALVPLASQLETLMRNNPDAFITSGLGESYAELITNIYGTAPPVPNAGDPQGSEPKKTKTVKIPGKDSESDLWPQAQQGPVASSYLGGAGPNHAYTTPTNGRPVEEVQNKIIEMSNKTASAFWPQAQQGPVASSYIGGAGASQSYTPQQSQPPQGALARMKEKSATTTQ
ncbi:hypothetical protein O1C60_000097 [Vibrio cholerae]|nr:hypothetical protein [Vibrio cholerae]EKF9647578.1 hypothetical protein [Vibrio cholerae]EKF9648831.1 hypothetical protein [Vibrio cholerae]